MYLTTLKAIMCTVKIDSCLSPIRVNEGYTPPRRRGESPQIGVLLYACRMLSAEPAELVELPGVRTNNKVVYVTRDQQ